MVVRALVSTMLMISVLSCGGGRTTEDDQETTQVPQRAGLARGSFAVEIEGRTIHYEVHGTGPVVMTVPNSWGLSLEGLRSLYRPLEDSVTMVYFDPRGMGSSSPVVEESDMGMAAVREDFFALQKHLELERVHAIGWSNGAMNLIELAAEASGRLDSAIFVHGVASMDVEDMKKIAEERPELFEQWGAFQEALTSPDLDDNERTGRMKAFWLQTYFPSSMAIPELSGPKAAEAFDKAQFSWPHAQYSNVESPFFDARDKLASVQTPCLVIAGAHDMMPALKVKELADGLPDARFLIFGKSGHFAPLEEPGAFKSAIVGFLSSQPQ